MSGPSGARADVEAIFAEVLRRLDPERLVREALGSDGDRLVVGGEELDVPGRLVVLAVGKAALPMARGAVAALGVRIDGGLVVTKSGFAGGGGRVGPLPVVESAHPVPDGRSVAAGVRLLALAAELGPEDLALVLVSGGGSALIEAPGPGITLEEIAGVTSALLRAGADIAVLNAARRRLSRIKAGGLARAARPARVVNLVISDVLGSPLPVIASGFAVDPGPPDDRHLPFLRSAGVWDELRLSLRRALTSTLPEDRVENVVHSLVLADARTAAQVAAAAARERGYEPLLLSARFEGEARDFGRFWAQLALGQRDLGGREPRCVVAAGEMTVTVRGAGRGGRNTEMAAAAALELRGQPDVVVASLATDGDDGQSGAAGGIVSGESVAQAQARGLDPRAALDDNDSATLLGQIDALVVTQPTGNNVNDLYLALIR